MPPDRSFHIRDKATVQSVSFPRSPFADRDKPRSAACTCPFHNKNIRVPQGTPYDEIIMELKDYILDIGPANVAMVGFDVSGVGKGLEDFVKRVQDLGIMVMPVEFSLQNKSRIYTLFKLLVENDRITIPFVEECDKQLAALRFKRSGRGYLQVHHQSETDRDDFPDALAGLCSLMIQPENVPVTCEII